MSMKDKLMVHREIEHENERKLKEWKDGGAKWRLQGIWSLKTARS